MLTQNVKSNMVRWNRKCLNGLWFILLITVLISIFNYFVPHTFDPKFYLLHRIVIPAMEMAAVLFLTEWLNLRLKRGHDFLIVTASVLLSMIIVHNYADIYIIVSVLILPILFSLFYLKKTIILYAGTASWLSFFILVFFNGTLRQSLNTTALITMPAILLAGVAIGASIMNRSQEIQKRLQQTMEERKKLLLENMIMDKIAKSDALTDLYNQRTFHEYLDKLIEKSEHDFISLHLAILDIDNFKRINDTYGHHTGDIVLKRVAEAIRTGVGPNDFVARYGGEEFAIIFTNRSFDEVHALVENIRQTIANVHHPEIGEPVTVSIGLHCYQKGDGKEKLFKIADSHLYQAKKSGKNKTVGARN